ncbi:hypothetical protein G6011_10143 [Alternaria panax]|uniref:Uncharacterized protein n=1 Tax=Alternaria panax TaxID=48097 RepID=A0AAD4I308_9PLEO|nr:hypothetical protein G6011_10143 [Alternaria panax]
MPEPREAHNVVGSLVNVIFWAFVAYCHYGSIIHRSTWDRQHIYLPFLFLFVPEIFLCQIVMNIVLLIHRHIGMSRLGIAMDHEGPWFYIAGVIDLHSASREFDQGVWIGGPDGGHAQKSEGNWRLSTLNASRLSRTRRTDRFDSANILRLLGTIFLLYQGGSASMVYVTRLVTIDSSTLSLDHLTGLYAICGTLVGLATLLILLQPYEWADNNRYIEEERGAMPDVDTSNAWVYEGFSAATLHGLLWLSLRAWGYGVAMVKHAKDIEIPISFMDAFTGPGIALLALMAIGVVFMVPTVGEAMFIPHRNGMIWLARFFNVTYWTAGRVFRLLLASVTATVAGLIWAHAILEVGSVTGGRIRPWNINWKEPNPTADTFFGAILSLSA